MKESMYIADREHKESLARMEHKFFLEKVYILELLKISLCVEIQKGRLEEDLCI